MRRRLLPVIRVSGTVITDPIRLEFPKGDSVYLNKGEAAELAKSILRVLDHQ